MVSSEGATDAIPSANGSLDSGFNQSYLVKQAGLIGTINNQTFNAAVTIKS